MQHPQAFTSAFHHIRSLAGSAAGPQSGQAASPKVSHSESKRTARKQPIEWGFLHLEAQSWFDRKERDACRRKMHQLPGSIKGAEE